MIAVDFNEGKLSHQIEKLARDAGISQRFICYDQMSLWLNDLIKSTPPSTYKQGRLSLLGDINKLFVSVGDPDFAELMEDLEADGQLPPGVAVNLEGDQIQRIHEGARNNRGRVRREGRKTGTFWEKTYVKRANVRKYKRRRLKAVGTLKAGWIPAAKYYGRLARRTAKIPKWIDKGQDQRGSTFGRMNIWGDGDIGSANSTRYAADAIRPHLIAWTRRKRQDDIVKRSRLRVKQLVKRFNEAA